MMKAFAKQNACIGNNNSRKRKVAGTILGVEKDLLGQIYGPNPNKYGVSAVGDGTIRFL